MTDKTREALAELQQEKTDFDYLLNRFERASQAVKPADHDYATHRLALFRYVRRLESDARAALQQEVPAEPVGAKWDYTVVGWCDEWALKLNQDTSIELTPRPGRRPVYVRSPKQ